MIGENGKRRSDCDIFVRRKYAVFVKNVLIAPLNWGLGHASRCIPLVRALCSRGVQVILASDGLAFKLLKAEFPELPLYKLPSYGVRYAGTNMVFSIAQQLPRLLYAIQAEHKAVAHLVREHHLDTIISDNRYGCFGSNAHNILLTHQLRLRVPGRPLAWLTNQLLRQALAKFDTLWVPDAAGEPNLSGELSHGALVHPDIQFIGPLSRMRHLNLAFEYDVVVVLSGPEPQRTYLENILLEQAVTLPQRFLFVQGKTHTQGQYFISENVEVVAYLTTQTLNQVLCASQYVVCRSGYSSIMDLAALGKKALLIPTPGQTEQEYLAERLQARGIMPMQVQHQINLDKGLKNLAGFSGFNTDSFAFDYFESYL